MRFRNFIRTLPTFIGKMRKPAEMKKGVTKEKVHQRLKDVFQDFAVDVWDAEIVY